MRTGTLRHGNPSGDPRKAPRCGARTRNGPPCQAPAIRGKRRCRLRGGLSTGPRTVEGLARLRAARMTHGRYSAEGRALARWRREILPAVLADSNRTWRPVMRSLYRRSIPALILQRAHADITARLVKGARQEIREDLTRRDAERLRAKGRRCRRPSRS